MGIFDKRLPKPSFGKFNESHFLTGSSRILWTGEEIVEFGFFIDGPDPLGEQESLGAFASLLGANNHTYVAITSWRLLLGFLANGGFSSYTRESIEELVTRNKGQYFYTFVNSRTKQSESPMPRTTFVVSAEFASKVQENGHLKPPVPSEMTSFSEYKKDWGQGPLADLARAKSGQDFLLMARCELCDSVQMLEKNSLTDEDIFPQICGACLRLAS